MAKHEYTAADALNELLERIRRLSPALAEQIQTAIERGREVQEVVEEPAGTKRGKKRKHKYWKSVPLTDAAALEVALNFLRAHLLESRLMLARASKDFAAVGVSPPKPIKQPKRTREREFSWESSLEDQNELPTPPKVEKIGDPKELAVEAEPETRREKGLKEDLIMNPEPESELSRLRSVFEKLGKCLHFDNQHHGNP